jgi:acyl carrier protein
MESPGQETRLQGLETERGKIIEFLASNYLISDESEIADDDSFLEKGILDSTSVLELVAHLEEAFGIEIADDDLTPENLDSISRVIAFVRSRK